MRPIDTKTIMLEHSEAKVKLYGTYLSSYLNILSRVPFVEEIYIFDLLCGEGIYENGAKGSPLVALETIKDHYFVNNATCPNITLWFNDNGLSEIEQDVYKVKRVERFSGNIFTPPNVKIRFYCEDYDQIHPRALAQVRHTAKARGLFFIDPYGYKDIKPKDCFCLHHICTDSQSLQYELRFPEART
jgi:three-Cys-motif partner protein